MGWMQSDEGMSVRKSVAYPEKTIGAMIPDKSGMLFKVNVHNEAGMKEFVNFGLNEGGGQRFHQFLEKMLNTTDDEVPTFFKESSDK